MLLEKADDRDTRDRGRYLRSLSYEDRLKKVKLPTLEYRRRRGDMLFIGL